MKPLRCFFSPAIACLAAVLLALSTATTFAQTVQLLCANPGSSSAGLVTVDYAARTLGVDSIDAAGNVTIMAYHRLPATVTDETVSATWKNGKDYMRFTLNRYSGVLRTESDFGAGYSNTYSNPCTKYQRGSRKF